jgi:hypothetical protein
VLGPLLRGVITKHDLPYSGLQRPVARVHRPASVRPMLAIIGLGRVRKIPPAPRRPARSPKLFEQGDPHPPHWSNTTYNQYAGVRPALPQALRAAGTPRARTERRRARSPGGRRDFADTPWTIFPSARAPLAAVPSRGSSALIAAHAKGGVRGGVLPSYREPFAARGLAHAHRSGRPEGDRIQCAGRQPGLGGEA